jgi:squalene-hopene/tetraprenyl-beta-curcumene cyclase
MKYGMFLAAFAILALFGGVFAEEAKREELLKAVEKGADFLAAQQNEDGGFGDFAGKRISSVGYTGMALSALAKSDAVTSRKHAEVVEKAAAFMLKNVRPDGGLYMTQEYYEQSGRKETFESYETSLAVAALAAVDAEKYREVIRKGAEYLMRIQDDGVKDHLSKGGIGYGSNKSMSNLSTTFFAFQALRAAGIPADAPVWKNAVPFISSCQNLAETNKLEWSVKSNDGGFIYSPIESKVGTVKPSEQPKTGEPAKLDDSKKVGDKKDQGGPRGPRRDPKLSYASMTCAGVGCLLMAGVEKDDVRVKAGLKWLSERFTLDENPGLEKQGLFYYYAALAACLSALDEKTIQDKDGAERNWAMELGVKLHGLQNDDGSWTNSADRWEEKNKVLGTSHALHALTRALAFLKE